jgi:hypothetical protein
MTTNPTRKSRLPLCLILTIAATLLAPSLYAQKGGGGGKGGGGKKDEKTTPLPDEYDRLDRDEAALISELSLRAIAWMTSGSLDFSSVRAEQIAPFFGSQEKDRDEKREEKEDKKEKGGGKQERPTTPDPVDSLTAIRNSLNTSPALFLYSALEDPQKEFLKQSIEQRQVWFEAYSKEREEISLLLGGLRSQGNAVQGSGISLTEVRALGAKAGKAEVALALAEAGSLTKFYRSLTSSQRRSYSKLIEDGVADLPKDALEKLAAAQKELTSPDLIALLERAVIWEEKGSRELSQVPLEFIADYFGDLSGMDPRKDRGKGEKEKIGKGNPDQPDNEPDERKDEEENGLGMAGSFLALLDRNQRGVMVDLTKTQARAIKEYQDRHADITGALLLIRRGASPNAPRLGQSAAELGALEAQMTIEQGGAFARLLRSMSTEQIQAIDALRAGSRQEKMAKVK